MSKVRIGIIGVGNRGSQLLAAFMANAGCEIVALCDVYRPYTTRNRDDVEGPLRDTDKVPAMGEKLGRFDRYTDFRELLGRRDIEAVCIATPDHWHAVQTIAAFRAGKDVFVEKPLTITVHEGRRMVEVEKETARIAAVGLNRRGSSVYRRCVEVVRSGKLGDIKAAYAAHNSVMFPTGIGRAAETEPPADLDWDLWLGPRPLRPYKPTIAPYCFRWWNDYSSQMGNWGVHYMDAIRWMMGATAPVSVSAVGTGTSVDDDRTIPDTMAVLFEMPNGCIVHFDVNEASGALRVPGREIMLCGTRGTLCSSENGYDVSPTRPGQFQTWKPSVDEESHELGGDKAFGDLGTKEDTTQVLVDDFVRCVRTREQPLCSLEDGHRSTTFAHLANISLRLRKRIEWDAGAERITNVPEADELLHYRYRAPWNLD
jgi:predicted dehydrogenase